MQKQEALNYEAQFGDAPLYFNPFAVHCTGIIKAQTLLKVDTYNLACVPYQFSMKRGILAGVFSKDEIAFFQRFKDSLAGLGLVFQRPDQREPMKIFCRCQIGAIGMMKEREGVGLIVCDWKPIPPDLAQVLGEHLMLLERLKLEFGDFRDKVVPITPDSAKRLGFNNYAIMSCAAGQQKLALFSIAVNKLEFLAPLRSADLVVGEKVSFALFFQRYRFSVSGGITGSERLQTGVQRGRAAIDFSPELVQLLEEYYVGH